MENERKLRVPSSPIAYIIDSETRERKRDEAGNLVTIDMTPELYTALMETAEWTESFLGDPKLED